MLFPWQRKIFASGLGEESVSSAGRGMDAGLLGGSHRPWTDVYFRCRARQEGAVLAFARDSWLSVRDVPISAFAWRLEQGGIDPFSANSQKSEPELAVQELDSSFVGGGKAKQTPTRNRVEDRPSLAWDCGSPVENESQEFFHWCVFRELPVTARPSVRTDHRPRLSVMKDAYFLVWGNGEMLRGGPVSESPLAVNWLGASDCE